MNNFTSAFATLTTLDDDGWRRVYDIISPARQLNASFPFLCDSEDKGDNTRSFTLEDVFDSSLKPKGYSIRWISGGAAITKHRHNSVQGRVCC